MASDSLEMAVAVERYRSENDMTYVEALIHWSEQQGIDIEVVAEAVKKDPVLKGKLQTEAELAHTVLASEARLPGT